MTLASTWPLRAAGTAASISLLVACLVARAGAPAGSASAEHGVHGARTIGSDPAHRERVHTVIIEQLRYEPAELVVQRGDRIVWINEDLIPHTVTAAGKAFDSGTIAAAGNWSYRARRAGRFSYACRFHPSMKGKLIVE